VNIQSLYSLEELVRQLHEHRSVTWPVDQLRASEATIA
jgi:hypothetical protein